MATERRLYNTVRIIHNVYYPIEAERWFEQSSPWSVLFSDRKQYYSILAAQFESYQNNQNNNQKCLVSDAHSLKTS